MPCYEVTPCQLQISIFDIIAGTNKLQRLIVFQHLTTLLYEDWLPQVNGPVEGSRIYKRGLRIADSLIWPYQEINPCQNRANPR